MASVLFGGASLLPRSLHHRNALICRAEARLPSDNTAQETSKDKMLARIAAARKYKDKGAGASPVATTSAPPSQQPPQPPTPSPPQPPTAAAPASATAPPTQGPRIIKDIIVKADNTNALAAFDAYAARQAQDEAEEFLQAQEQFAASRPSTPPPPPPPPVVAAVQTAQPTSQEQQQQEQQQNNEGGEETTVDRDFRQGTGSSEQAANWLQTIATQGRASQLDSSMRPEQFTAKKEELQRQQGAEIERAKGIVSGTRRRFDSQDYGLAQQQDEAQASMSADRAAIAAAKAAAAMQEEAIQDGVESESSSTPGSTESVHNPAVATWGVFPRPRNISQAYGGGRNLKPGQALESEEDAAERQKRVSAALADYKKSIGLDIDPAVEAKAYELYGKGEQEFKAGRIGVALAESAALVPLRSKIGGQAALQKAICLDSLGYNKEAYSIYTSLEGHSGPGVAKAAKRFLFGFKAAQKLKVDTMYYGSGGVEAWQGYFDRINSNTWSEYRAKGEESEEDDWSAKTATIVAISVVLVPLALTAAFILSK